MAKKYNKVFGFITKQHDVYSPFLSFFFFFYIFTATQMTPFAQKVRKIFVCCIRPKTVDEPAITSSRIDANTTAVAEQEAVPQTDLHLTAWENPIRSPVDLQGIANVDAVVQRPADLEQTQLFPVSWKDTRKDEPVKWGSQETASEWTDIDRIARDEVKGYPLPWQGKQGFVPFDSSTVGPSWVQGPTGTNQQTEESQVDKDRKERLSRRRRRDASTSSGVDVGDIVQEEVSVAKDEAKTKETLATVQEEAGAKEALATVQEETGAKETLTSVKEEDGTQETLAAVKEGGTQETMAAVKEASTQESSAAKEEAGTEESSSAKELGTKESSAAKEPGTEESSAPKEATVADDFVQIKSTLIDATKPVVAGSSESGSGETSSGEEAKHKPKDTDKVSSSDELHPNKPVEDN